MALLALLAEGSMGDWSAVYLRLSLGTSAGLAAVGFAAFQLTMAAGRFAGDRLVERLGSKTVVRASGSMAAIGLGGALIVGSPIAAIIGCACVGLGLSNLIPMLFRAAAQIPGISAGHGIAAVSTAGYCGFLAGPR
jgi:fucose permease